MGIVGPWEVVLFASAGLAAVILLAWGHRPRSAAWVLAALAAGVCVGGTVAWTAATAPRLESRSELLAAVPDLGQPEFVSSDACRACHPTQHRSWHESFHRTMTQVAGPETVLGDFDGVHLESWGRTYDLSRRGDEFLVEMVDPDWEHDRIAEGVHPSFAPDPPRVEKRVVMTTGSHHMQTCWVASDRDGRLFNLPFAWLNDDRRWAPREDVFLRDPSLHRQFGTWHDNCIECHAVAGEPRRDGARFDPRVAELGIACEACHGPGGEHVRVNRDPARRYRYRLGDEPDPTIVNPRRLPARASAQICGQCHGMNVFKMEAIRAGGPYRAGGDLTETRIVLRTSDRNLFEDERADWPRLQTHVERQRETFLEERFWPDGMVRVSGREHNAMIESACFLEGDLSCLSCHSMHEPISTDDMLAAGMDGDEACFQCHGSYRDAVETHTHHEPESSGSRCVNCHMPHTTYGLMKAIRSHQIDSPTVRSSLDTGRPNACNLCHLDRTLRWSADHLAEWYGQPQVELEPRREIVSAAVLWLLAGDANQRALVAWHMGWTPAVEASGRDWLAPYLGHALADPYSCVRYIAYRSLRRLPGFERFGFDFLGPPADRSDARVKAVTRWMSSRPPELDRTGREILIDEAGNLDRARLTGYSRLRDDRVLDLRE